MTTPVRTTPVHRLLILFVTSLATLLAVAPPASADTVILQGSTTFNAELIVGNQPDIERDSQHKLTVIPNKSNLGLLALLKHDADLAMISTALANEKQVLKTANPTLDLDLLEVVVIASTHAALITYADNPVRSISPENLRRVFTGEITNWSSLGGNDRPIRLVAVREGGGVVSSVEAAILGHGHHITAPDQIRVQNGSQILKVVEQEPDALGVTQNKLIAGHHVNQVDIGPPIEQQLGLVSLGHPSPAAAAVIEAFRAAAKARIE